MNKEQTENLPAEESVEIELSEVELRNLARPRLSQRPVEHAPGRSGRSPALIVGASSAAILAACAGVWALNADTPREVPPPPPAALAAVEAPPVAAAPVVPEGPPVRIRNPFDKGEWFEFPAGTSEEDARAAVADTLMQRAMERQDVLDTRPSKRKRSAQQPGQQQPAQRRRV
jgi:hypothetical protein